MKSTNVKIGGKEFLFIKDSYAPKEVAKLMKQAYELALDNNHILHGKAADDFIKRMKAQEGKKISKKQQKFLDECVKMMKNSQAPKKCEAGCKNDSQVMHEDLLNGVKTFLCKNCEIEYVTYNLSPKQFRSMLKNGHTTEEYMLHGDFYDEKGVAQQPLGERNELRIS